MSGSKGKNKAGQALRRLRQKAGDPNDITADLFGELEKKYDDRSAALVFSAFVEEALQRALAAHFVTTPEKIKNLFQYSDNEGPLSTFASKIVMGEALGVYENYMRSDLHIVKEIRNAFAHSPLNITFDTEEIRDACAEIHVQVKNFSKNDKSIKIESARQQYATLCTKMHHYLSLGVVKPLRWKETPTYVNFYPFAEDIAS